MFYTFNRNSLHIEIPQNQSAIQRVSLPRPLPLHPTHIAPDLSACLGVWLTHRAAN